MITVEHAHKTFGKVVALDDVSLAIRPGDRVALVGTNGSGKTTLLRALCGVLRVSGKIEVFGRDVVREPQLALRAVSYMPQVAPPLDAPVGELVRAYCALRGLKPERVATFAARLDLDLAAVKRSRVRDLSGGMKQKLLAALALSCDAPVLVCDEPTASLDSHARAAFFELVAERPESSTLVLCSHRVEEMERVVNRVIELKDGRVLHDAAPCEVLQKAPTVKVHDRVSADAGRPLSLRPVGAE